MGKLGLLIVAIALFASACSSGSSDELPATSEPPPSTTVGPTTTAAPATTAAPGPSELTITSPLFEEGDTIPTIITCEGDDISPQVDIAGLPADTASIVIVMEDPDAPVRVWDHWVMFDIEPTDSLPSDVGGLGTLGTNSWGDAQYGGPCPPPGGGRHRYITTVYALDVTLGLDPGSTKDTVLAALTGNLLAQGALIGTFER